MSDNYTNVPFTSFVHNKVQIQCELEYNREHTENTNGNMCLSQIVVNHRDLYSILSDKNFTMMLFFHVCNMIDTSRMRNLCEIKRVEYRKGFHEITNFPKADKMEPYLYSVQCASVNNGQFELVIENRDSATNARNPHTAEPIRNINFRESGDIYIHFFCLRNNLKWVRDEVFHITLHQNVDDIAYTREKPGDRERRHVSINYRVKNINRTAGVLQLFTLYEYDTNQIPHIDDSKPLLLNNTLHLTNGLRRLGCYAYFVIMRMFSDYKDYIGKSKLTPKYKLIVDYVSTCRRNTIGLFSSPTERGEYAPIVNGERYPYNTDHITALIRSAKKILTSEKGSRLKLTNTKTQKLVDCAELVYKDIHDVAHVTNAAFKPNELKYLVANYLVTYPNGSNSYGPLLVCTFNTQSTQAVQNNRNICAFVKIKPKSANSHTKKSITSSADVVSISDNSETSSNYTVSCIDSDTSTAISSSVYTNSVGTLDPNLDENGTEFVCDVESNMDITTDANIVGKEFFDSKDSPVNPRNAFMERRENVFRTINLEFWSDSVSKLNMTEWKIEYNIEEQTYYVYTNDGIPFKVINIRTVNNCRTIYQLDNLEIYEIIAVQTKTSKYSFNRSLTTPLQILPPFEYDEKNSTRDKNRNRSGTKTNEVNSMWVRNGTTQKTNHGNKTTYYKNTSGSVG